LIPPYDYPAVIAGAGTAVKELLEEVPDLDVILVCTGGGGFLAGSAVAAKGISPGVSLYGVEPAAGDDWKQSLDAGARIALAEVPRTIADGQQTQAPGELTFPIVQALVDGIALVTDDELVETMAVCFERLKVVVEPSGATALAAVLANRVDVTGKRVGVTLSGGNIAIDRFVELMAGRA
jgi:threonine dehydratase